MSLNKRLATAYVSGYRRSTDYNRDKVKGLKRFSKKVLRAYCRLLDLYAT
jgi:hypothetical protein